MGFSKVVFARRSHPFGEFKTKNIRNKLRIPTAGSLWAIFCPIKSVLYYGLCGTFLVPFDP